MTYYVVRTDGRIDTAETAPLTAMMVIKKAIDAESLTTVNLRDGRVMLVDDCGHGKAKPINPNATRLYWSICKPGTHWTIRGDAVVCNDVDFEGSMSVTGFRSKPTAPPAPPVIPANGLSELWTPYMVHCLKHGEVYLTIEEYDRQMMAADGLWTCPIDLTLATWDDANYERGFPPPQEPTPPPPAQPLDSRAHLGDGEGAHREATGEAPNPTQARGPEDGQ